MNQAATKISSPLSQLPLPLILTLSPLSLYLCAAGVAAASAGGGRELDEREGENEIPSFHSCRP